MQPQTAKRVLLRTGRNKVGVGRAVRRLGDRSVSRGKRYTDSTLVLNFPSPRCSLVPESVRWSVVASRCAQARRPTPSRRLLTLFTLRAAATRVLSIIMAKSSTRRSRKSNSTLRPRPTVGADAAGIDLGATEHFVAVPPERDPQPVRSFTTDTAALQALADWLIKCGVLTVAMEATGVYWVPLFQVLEARGLARLRICELPDNASRDKLFDLGVAWYWLRHLRFRVLIPVVLTTVPDEDCTAIFDFPDQITPLHANSNLARRLTNGMTPDDKSWYKSARCSFRSSKLEPCVR